MFNSVLPLREHDLWSNLEYRIELSREKNGMACTYQLCGPYGASVLIYPITYWSQHNRRATWLVHTQFFRY